MLAPSLSLQDSAIIRPKPLFYKGCPMKFKALVLSCLFSLNSFAAVEIPEAAEIMLDEEVIEAPAVRIKDVKELITSIGPEKTCMDEYLKRRKQLIIKLSLSPVTIVAGTYAATIGGAFVGLGVVYVTGIDPLAGVVLSMFGSGLATGVGTSANTSIAAFQLADVDRILKTLAELHLNHPGKKSAKLYAKYAKNSRNPVNEQTFLGKLLELDNSGNLCDGSMVKKPRLASGRKLKHKLARSKQLAEHI